MQLAGDFLLYFTLTVAFALTLLTQISLLIKCARQRISDRLSANILINMFCWCLASVSGGFYMGYMGLFEPASKNGTFI
jgi:nucleoside permease NupC